ncbi:MAG: hypothetical protein R3F25_10335 [Gammaproteobacteria bacterium]
MDFVGINPSTDDEPSLNQTFLDAFGYPNNSVIDSGVLQPRIGFNCDMSDEYAMQLRGGVGIFSGGSPNVWLSNPYTNPGDNVNNYRIFGYSGDYILMDIVKLNQLVTNKWKLICYLKDLNYLQS